VSVKKGGEGRDDRKGKLESRQNLERKTRDGRKHKGEHTGVRKMSMPQRGINPSVTKRATPDMTRRGHRSRRTKLASYMISWGEAITQDEQGKSKRIGLMKKNGK